MWSGPGAAFLLFATFATAATRDSTQSAALGAQQSPSKNEIAFLATLRRALNDELRSPSVPRASYPQPPQLAVREAPSEDRAEDEREEAEAEAQAKAARDELQQIEEQARVQASRRDEAIRDEQDALGREHAALRATAAAPVAVAAAVPAVQPTFGGSAPSTQQFSTGAPASQAQPRQPAAAAAVTPMSMPVTQPLVTAQSTTTSDAIVPQSSGNTSQIDSEKTATLAANIAKVARWKEAQAAKMMETAKDELTRVELDSKNVEKAKEWYAQLTQKAQQFVKEAAADREAAKEERKKAEDARAAAEWEAERANGARVQAEQDWQRAQLMQKDAEAVQAQVEKQQAELKQNKLEANLEMRKAEEAHAKSERERAQLRLEELAFQKLRAQALAAAQAPTGTTPRSSIAIAGEQVRSFGSVSQTAVSPSPMSQAASSREAVSKVVLDAAREVLGPHAPLPVAADISTAMSTPSMPNPAPQAQYQRMGMYQGAVPAATVPQVS